MTKRRILLLEPFEGPSIRQLLRSDPEYLALGLQAITIVMNRTGPMRLKSMVSSPLGLAQLSAALKRRGYDAEHEPFILRRQRGTLSDRYLRSRLSAHAFDAACLSVGDPQSVREAKRFARLCKEVRPHAPVIVGGSQPTFHPEDFVGAPHVDWVVRGQGDEVLPDLLDSYFAGAVRTDLVGVCYDGRVTPERAPLIPPDRLPAMDLAGVHGAQYLKSNQLALVQSSHGCPYACPFCLHYKLWGQKPSFRPLANLEQELRFLHQHGARFVYFIDSTFTLDRDHALAVADLIIRNGFRMHFCCETRADLVDEQLLARLKQAGFVLLWLGGESGSPQILARLHGKARDRGTQYLESMRAATRHARAVDLLVGASWIIGLPGETPATIAETRDFIRELIALGMDTIDIRSLVLLPGTDYHDAPAAHGLSLTGARDRTHQFQAHSVAAATEAMTAEQIRRARIELQRELGNLLGARRLGLARNLLTMALRDQLARVPGLATARRHTA